MRVRFFAVLAAASAMIGPASAQQSPPATSETSRAVAAVPSATVSGVTVTASKPTSVSGVNVAASGPCTVEAPDGKANIPDVVDTFPRRDSKIQPGLIFLRVTFSEPMSRCNYYLNIKDGVHHPIILSAPVRMSPDRKTFLFAALVGPNTENYMWIGRAADPANAGSFSRSGPSPLDFRSRYGVSAKSYRLRFSVSGGPMVRTVAAALTADPAMPALMAEQGDFLRMPFPERSDRVDLLRCTDCDVDPRVAYAKVADTAAGGSGSGNPAQAPDSVGGQGPTPSIHP